MGPQHSNLSLASLAAALAADAENVRLGGGPAAIERQHAKGRLTARERIGLTLDPAASWLEIGLWAAGRCMASGAEPRRPGWCAAWAWWPAGGT